MSEIFLFSCAITLISGQNGNKRQFSPQTQNKTIQNQVQHKRNDANIKFHYEQLNGINFMQRENTKNDESDDSHKMFPLSWV